MSLITPRPGWVNPDTCPVCAGLRDALATAIDTGDRQAARAVVHAMHTHMIFGHPNDPRTIRSGESNE